MSINLIWAIVWHSKREVVDRKILSGELVNQGGEIGEKIIQILLFPVTQL